MKKIYLNEEFDRIWEKISNKENFALTRNGDGELALILGKKVTAQEGWSSPEYVSKLGRDIYQALTTVRNNLIHGISCPCCDREAYYWYSTRIKNKNITFANIWVGCNFSKFKEKFGSLKRKAVLIANYRAKNKKIGNLDIIHHYEIDDDCVAFWETKWPKMLENIKKNYLDLSNILYVVSAGPMATPIIVELQKLNPNNCYLDVGSALDVFYREEITRPYQIKDHELAKKKCWMFDPKVTCFDVSVVLNLYKRPENLHKQIESIKRQSLRPKEILLYQDAVRSTGDIAVRIPSDIEASIDVIEIGRENKGVWERFRFAEKRAVSKYICVFDDDTIPGKRWLENCHYQIMHNEGLYGTIGIVLLKERGYPFGDKESYFRVGWDGNLNQTVEVDFVGHSWFFKKEWLKELLKAPEYIQQKVAGEDIGFSYQLQRIGIKTYVPPHPYHQYDYFGSIPEHAIELGQAKEPLSFDTSNLNSMSDIVIYLQKEGWRPLFRRDPERVFSLFNTVCPERDKTFKIYQKRKSQYYVVYKILGCNFKFKRKGAK